MVRGRCPSYPDEIATLRWADTRLREVIEANDTEVDVLRSLVEAHQAQLEEPQAEVEALPHPSAAGPVELLPAAMSGRADQSGLEITAAPVPAQAPPFRRPVGATLEITDLLAVTVSPGAFTAMIRRVAACLGGCLDANCGALGSAEVAHFLFAVPHIHASE